MNYTQIKVKIFMDIPESKAVALFDPGSLSNLHKKPYR